MSTKKSIVILLDGTKCSDYGIYSSSLLNIDVSNLSSFYVSEPNSIWTTKDGKAYAVGNSSLLPPMLEKEAEIIITDRDGYKCKVISAASSLMFSLFLVSQSDGTNQLVYNKNDGKPLFVNLRGRKPIAIFGGHNSAAIDSDGAVIPITDDVFKSGAEAFFLPDRML